MCSGARSSSANDGDVAAGLLGGGVVDLQQEGLVALDDQGPVSHPTIVPQIPPPTAARPARPGSPDGTTRAPRADLRVDRRSADAAGRAVAVTRVGRYSAQGGAQVLGEVVVVRGRPRPPRRRSAWPAPRRPGPPRRGSHGRSTPASRRRARPRRRRPGGPTRASSGWPKVSSGPSVPELLGDVVVVGVDQIRGRIVLPLLARRSLVVGHRLAPSAIGADARRPGGCVLIASLEQALRDMTGPDGANSPGTFSGRAHRRGSLALAGVECQNRVSTRRGRVTTRTPGPLPPPSHRQVGATEVRPEPEM